GGGADGSGGTITINATAATLGLISGVVAANAAGTGAAKGGTIDVNVSSISVSGHNALTFNADGTGNGGEVTLKVAGSLTIGSAPRQILISAAGGNLLGASAGDGGTISVSTGGGLVVNPAALTAGPLGANGQGGTVKLSTGSDSAAINADLVINGTLDVSGKGNSSGGQAELSAAGLGRVLVTGNIVADS